MRDASDIIAFIRGRADLMALLRPVEDLTLPDCWVAAGTIRNAVWDQLHGYQSREATSDVDVIFFDPSDPSAERDSALEAALVAVFPAAAWSVKNQARMHIRNSDAPYAGSAHALRSWPETCTAIGARLNCGNIELLAPFGVIDLLDLVVAPPPAAGADTLRSYRTRLEEKAWLRAWPRLRVRWPPLDSDAVHSIA